LDPSDFDVDDDSAIEQAPRRLDVEWAVASAIRDLMGIALKGVQEPTYAAALALGAELVPSLLGEGSLLGSHAEPPELRLYRERAEAESVVRGTRVTARRLIRREIRALERLLAENPDKPALEKRLRRHQQLLHALTKRVLSEHQAIQRDAFTARHELPVLPIPETGYVDYRLPKGTGLRIRVLHPDRAEAATGADVIYEMYSDRKKTARIAALQYKLWDGRALYFSKASGLGEQLERLDARFCKAGLCATNPEERERYRLPACAAFLRPTDRLQSPDARLISSGLHIPVCGVFRCQTWTQRKRPMLERKFFRRECVTHKVFEELFNTGILGSRWLTYAEIEAFYRSAEILNPGEHILLHAQEFAVSLSRSR
jgi:hypothetical protein